MKNVLVTTLLLVTAELSAASAQTIPFPSALDEAAVVQERLDDLLDNSLILGNGDINALLFATREGLTLNLTKNDVWDARVDSSAEQPLLKVDIAARKWEGGEQGNPNGYSHPYPCPRICARLVLGDARGPTWKAIRGEGRLNEWTNREGAAVMAIEGQAGASNGFAYGPLDVSTDQYPKLRLKLSGTGNTRFYVDVLAPDHSYFLSSRWIDSPRTLEERTFSLPPGKQVGQIILYTWTVDGKRSENRFHEVTLQGPDGDLALDLHQLSPPPAASALDLRRAVAKVAGQRGETLVRALAQRNAFLIHSSLPTRLEPTTDTYLPGVERGETDGVQWLRQQLPADLDWPGMSFVVARAAAGDRQAVAMVTSLESKDPLADAIELTRTTLAQPAAQLIAEHEVVWERFWSASGIEISDAFLRNVFYRSLYFLRCVSKPGVQAAGLFAGLINSTPAWHGDYHSNYNSWQTFWPAYVCNHIELAEPFERLVSEYLPRGRWLARQTYDCGGAHFPISLFAYEPAPGKLRSINQRTLNLFPWSYTIGQTGWMVQNLWLHYQYQPDRAYLERIAYPALRDAAVFYADFMDKCHTNAAGRVILGPSYSPEHRGFGIDNCPCDIAYARFSLEAAIAAAGILNQDAALVARFQGQLARLPEYPVTPEPEPMVTDVEGGAPLNYNIAVPVLPVFPAGQITVFSGKEQQALFRRTIERVKWNGYNSSIIMPVARARLSFPDSAEYMQAEFLKRSRPNGTITLLPSDRCGHFTEQFAAAGAIAELLLQSVGDILRVFPAWPKEQNAKFENLRAQGGFLVSAEQQDGKVTKLQIVSTVGGKLRLLDPWTDKLFERETKSGEVVSYPNLSP
ncbi:MAG: hypothetical protein NTY19_19725 [Planctomycetota bacterium]|nr:hypothetical protein [Planctomycetota bacterium]